MHFLRCSLLHEFAACFSLHFQIRSARIEKQNEEGEEEEEVQLTTAERKKEKIHCYYSCFSYYETHVVQTFCNSMASTCGIESCIQRGTTRNVICRVYSHVRLHTHTHIQKRGEEKINTKQQQQQRWRRLQHNGRFYNTV